MDNDVTVWFKIDGAWVDFTNINDRMRVLVDDGDPGITLTRGSGDASPSIGPSSIEFAYLDSNGWLDGENYQSPYFRKIVPGTPVRVQLDGVTQQVGEFASALPSWEDGGEHPDGQRVVIVSATCSDTQGRLLQNDPAVESPMTRYYRTLSQSPDYGLMHWWSFEDGEAATRVVSNYGGRPLTGVGPFGNTDGPPGAGKALQQRYEARTAPIADLSTNLQVIDLVPHSAPMVDTDWTLEVAGKWPAVAVTDDTAPSLLVEWRTHGLPGYWQIRADYTTKCIEVHFFNNALSTFTMTSDVVARDDEWHLIQVAVSHSGADFNVNLGIDGEAVLGQLVTGAATSPPKAVYIYNYEDVDGSIRPAISQLTLWEGTYSSLAAPFAPAPNESYTPFTGYADESGFVRTLRLGTENGFDVTSDGVTGAVRLGPQEKATLSQILSTTAETDASWWFAAIDSENTIHRLALDSLYNQAPTFSASYAQLGKPFSPVPDDRIANVVTASQVGGTGEGGSAVASIPDDDHLHWSTQAPPDGAYARPDSMSVNISDDGALIDVAAWRAHERSWREKRYTAFTYDLARSVFSANDIAAVRSLDLGRMIAQDTTGSPPWVPYNEIRGLVRGWKRTLGKLIDTWTIATVPADIYEVVTTDSSGSTLVAAIDDNDTTAKIATSSGPSWSASTSKLAIDGDAVGVSAMVTATAAFGAVGAMAHADNATINPALPAGMTPDIGTSVFCFAVIRNSSASLAVPAGWTMISTGFAEIRFLHRYYTTGMSAPAIVPSGGAAGDTVSGICWSFTGLTPHTDNTNGFGGVWSSTNASAQNIAFPVAPVRTARTRGMRENGAVTFLLAWKADDWTSVAGSGTHTEMFDGSTTTGNDQGLWGAYKINATPLAYPGTAATVTGGAAAISKGFVVVLRPQQIATIERGIAGTPVAHTEGDEIHAWHMGVRAL